MEEKEKYVKEIMEMNTPEKMAKRLEEEAKILEDEIKTTPTEKPSNSLIVDGKAIEVGDTNDVWAKLRPFMEGLKNNDRIEVVATIMKEDPKSIMPELETFLSDEEREKMRERVKFEHKSFTIYPRTLKGQYVLFDLVNRHAKTNGIYGYIDKDDLMSNYAMSYWNFIHWLRSDSAYYIQYEIGKQKGRKGQFKIEYFNKKELPMPKYMLHPAPIGKGRVDDINYEDKLAELVEWEIKHPFMEGDLNSIFSKLKGDF